MAPQSTPIAYTGAYEANISEFYKVRNPAYVFASRYADYIKSSRGALPTSYVLNPIDLAQPIDLYGNVRALLAQFSLAGIV